VKKTGLELTISKAGDRVSRRAVQLLSCVVASLLAASLARESQILRGLELWVAAIAAGLTFVAINLGRAIGGDNASNQVPPPRQGAALVRVPSTVNIVPLVDVRKVANLRNRKFHRFENDAGFPVVDSPPHRLSSRIDRGQAPKLLGNWIVVSLFVGCDGRPWSDSEIASRLDSLLRAGRWVAGEASRYGITLALGVCDTYFAVEDDSTIQVEIGFALEGNDIGPAEADVVGKALTLMSRGARQLGFRDAPEMVEGVAARLSGSRCVWFLHIRRGGRSLAVPLDITELDGVCLAVCFAREASFTESIVRIPGPDAATFVHELLHLFGATDKYGVPLNAFPPGSVTASDVMRLDQSRLARLRVDPYTAAEIGWMSGMRDGPGANAAVIKKAGC
jgi:hypothetical protein